MVIDLQPEIEKNIIAKEICDLCKNVKDTSTLGERLIAEINSLPKIYIK